MGILLNVENLNVGYDKESGYNEIINNVSIQIRENSRVGIIGESGSGKTQIVHSILGLLNGTPGIKSGHIEFQGKQLLNSNEADEKTWRRHYANHCSKIRGNDISIIFQDARASLIPYQTIEEQIIETWGFLDLKGGKQRAIEKASLTLQILNLNGINRVLKSYPNQLSGGECQRVYIMLALLGDPDLLIADEPTSSLDDANAIKLLDHLNEICISKGISLLLISHEIDDVIRYTDTIYVLYDGHIVEAFDTSHKKSLGQEKYPFHPYTKTLLQLADEKLDYFSIEDPVTSIILDNDDGGILEKEKVGCPYYNQCGLRKSLSKDSQNKCLTKKPTLRRISTKNKAACWYVD